MIQYVLDTNICVYIIKRKPLRAFLEKQSKPIGSLDMLIAAHVLSIDGILVTNNEKEFSRVPKLSIENWAR